MYSALSCYDDYGRGGFYVYTCFDVVSTVHFCLAVTRRSRTLHCLQTDVESVNSSKCSFRLSLVSYQSRVDCAVGGTVIHSRLFFSVRGCVEVRVKSFRTLASSERNNSKLDNSAISKCS